MFLSKVNDDRELGKILLTEKSEAESSGLDITSLYFRNSQGNVIEAPVSGESAWLCMFCKARERIEDVVVDIGVMEISGGSDHAFRVNSKKDGESLNLSPGDHEIQLQMPCLGLKPGLYNMKIWLFKSKLFSLDIGRII